MTWGPFDALLKFRVQRVLTADEYTWAGGVFGDTLPPREHIRVSPAPGAKRRPFTFPWFRGRVLMFLGEVASDPVHRNGPLFAHELTHVWQIHHAKHRLPWLAGAIVTQLRFTFGRNVYAVGEATEPWASYSIEQQATIVEHWVAHRDDLQGRRLQHYLDANVRSAGQPG